MRGSAPVQGSHCVKRPAGWDSSRDPDAPRIIKEAAEHLAVTVNRRPSRAEKRALDLWLAQDPRHAQAWADVRRLWEGASDLPEAKARATKAKTITRRHLGKTALLIAAGGAAAWYFSDRPFADFSTGTGERKSVTAPDGSQIDLATHTRLSIAFDAAQRKIVLHDGEAFFRVAADRRPFVVAAGAGTTTALGTAFGVEYRDSDARVIVTESVTQVAFGSETVRVAAGSQLRYSPQGMGTLQSSDPDIDLGWRDGRLVFAGEPLGDVVRTLNMWRQGRIVVMDRELAARPITLIVHVDRSETIVGQLERVLPLRVVQITPFLILLLPKI